MNTYSSRCNSGKCISRTWVCDKEPDCQGKEDEDMCEHLTPKECSHEEFTCSTGSCVPVSYINANQFIYFSLVSFFISIIRKYAFPNMNL